jgi:hypothetical protein
MRVQIRVQYVKGAGCLVPISAGWRLAEAASGTDVESRSIVDTDWIAARGP